MLTVEIPNSKNLKLPLSRIAAAVNRNTPIETCVHIGASDEGLLLTSVDSRTHQLRLKVHESISWSSGECIVPADIFNQFAATLTSDDIVQLAVDDLASQLVVHQTSTHADGGTKVKLDLFTSGVEEFPLAPTLPPVVAELDAQRLSEAIKKALRLSEKDEFITFVGEKDTIKIYTRGGSGRIFSRMLLQSTYDQESWSVSIPMNLLAKLPLNFTGVAELRLDDDNFAISVGQEHLIVRQIATDTVSNTIDRMMDKATDTFWMIKAEPFKLDLKRAAIIKDKHGLKIRRDKQVLKASCGAPSKATFETPHQLVDASGKIVEQWLDPTLLARAIDALECVDLVGEQVEEVIPSFLEDNSSSTIRNIRLFDNDQKDYLSIVMTEIQV